MARRAARRDGRRLEVLPVASEAEARRARESALRLLAEWIRAAEPWRDRAPGTQAGGERSPARLRSPLPGEGEGSDARGDLPPRLHR